MLHQIQIAHTTVIVTDSAKYLLKLADPPIIHMPRTVVALGRHLPSLLLLLEAIARKEELDRTATGKWLPKISLRIVSQRDKD
jgi:hypothetical protein